MDVTIKVVGDDADGLRSLREWMVREEELRGRVALVEPPPEQGRLGSFAEALLVALAPGGAATVMASVIITWIRHRSHDAEYEITRPDGTTVRVSAKRARGAEAAAMRELIVELAEPKTTVLQPPDGQKAVEQGEAAER